MENQKSRTYVGKGVKAGQFDLVNISICIDDAEPHFFEYNGKRYVKLTVGGLRETDQYGKTHSVWVNEYKPEAKTEPQTQKQQVNQPQSDLPF